MKIIDVSKWQGVIDWKKAKSDGVELAILRASCGYTKDEKINDYVYGCNTNGIPFGVYHYLCSNTVTAAQHEAKIFWNAAKKYKPAFWVLDFEDQKLVNLSTANKKNVAQAFVKQLRSLGVDRIVIYTWEWLGKLLPTSDFGWAWRWYASYGKNTGVPTSTVNGCSLHQYTSRGRVNGINTNVDLNQLKDGKTIDFLIGKETTSEPKTKKVKIVNCTAVNVRSGPNVKYKILDTVKVGTEFEYLGVADNGWKAVEIDSGTGWVSGNYSKVE